VHCTNVTRTQFTELSFKLDHNDYTAYNTTRIVHYQVLFQLAGVNHRVRQTHARSLYEIY